MADRAILLNDDALTEKREPKAGEASEIGA
jgi:hypothetical protein